MTISSESELAICKRILESVGAAILLFDKTYRLIYMNTAAEMLLAGSSRQLMGLRARDLTVFSKKDIERDLERTIESGISLTQRNLVLTLPERLVTVNFCATPLYEGTQPTAILVEIQQVDRDLRISWEEQLIAQQTATQMLVRRLAHEIKNPLGGVRGAAQLLEHELNDPELREYTRIIIEESDRLRELMDRMLGPNKPPKNRLLNIHRVLERVRQLVLAEAPPGVDIKRNYDPSLPPLYGDSDQLIQVFLNIARNAAQAVGNEGVITFKTRIHRQVTIGTQRNKLAVRVDVIDNGPGISPELISQIFYPMVTGRENGTGLGLSIALSLINQHGGTVECSSVPGNTVFSIYLPLEKYDEQG